MKKIFYWSPCLANIGTINSTLNSAIGLKKYFNNKYDVSIINSCGEWNHHKNYLKLNGIKVIDLGFNYFQFLPKKGFFLSRLSYITIFLLSFIPLKRLIITAKPDFFISHLITSLPLFLKLINNFKTKFILRISGFPKLNYLRKYFWSVVSDKVYIITFPSKGSLFDMSEKKIFKNNQMHYLEDPFINISKFIVSKKNNHNLFYKNELSMQDKYFIAVGRLTNQKNFKYLINEFSKFNKLNNNYKLLIFGEGEQKESLKKLIRKYNSTNKILLMGFSKNIYKYMINAEAFILSSLWEDPGSVIIEAALSNLFIISSNCKNGPSEFLNNGKAGILYNSNFDNALLNSLIDFTKKKDLSRYKILAKKNVKNFTMFKHSLKLNKLLSNEF